MIFVMDKKNLRVVFMGTPEISATVLKALIEDGYQIVGVIAQPDKPVGRKGILEKVPTKVVAEQYNIPTFQPVKIRKEYDFLKELNPDVIVTIAYGQIVSQEVLDIPKYGCLNLHGSILPKYRGASPIQAALINNESVSGMTLMQMIYKMDAGKMYDKELVKISEDDNCTSIFTKMGEAAKTLILRALPLYIDGKLEGVEQDEDIATYCKMISSEQEKIDFSMQGETIVGWIRALSDHPGAYLFLDDLKVKIFKARFLDEQFEGSIGEIVKADKNGLYIKVNDGVISILELQKEGKKRMDYRSFINGNQNLLGKIAK